jgi:hypothetical protein
MTFGTPHLGVEGAERLGQLGFICTDKQAKDLEVFTRSSRELRKDWDSYFGSNDSKYRVTIRTFYGSEDTFVSQDSACGRFPECEQINALNHVMIVKPTDTNHSAYKKLRVQMESMIGQVNGPTLLQRQPPSAKEEQTLHSINTTVPAQIRFSNEANVPVQVHWLDNNGNRITYCRLEVGESCVMDTFVTHPWVITDFAGKSLGLFMPEPGFHKALIK